MALGHGPAALAHSAQRAEDPGGAPYVTLHRTVTVDGLDIFYREAGPQDAPTIVLLHGFPTSSQMFRNLIPALADRFHVVAPDYPGFGNSAMPSLQDFDYSFDNLAKVVGSFLEELGLARYSLYLDFWDPFRAYWNDRNAKTAEPLEGFLQLGVTKWQYTHGVRNEAAISPDTWTVDQYQLDRPGNKEIQLQLFHDYGSNPPLYPAWQAYFREHQPPTLIVWGKNDHIFPAEGAEPYKRDLKNLEFHLLDTGHFALEEDGDFIAARIRDFVSTHTA
jgi:pimeloyl-ACP methyl ester carboxylesterase